MRRGKLDVDPLIAASFCRIPGTLYLSTIVYNGKRFVEWQQLSMVSPELATIILKKLGSPNMKAYIGIKYYKDYRNRPMIQEILSALRQNGFETCCIMRDIEKWGVINLEAADLMRVTFEEIDTCDIVVIDLTEKGVGLGIEAGYAYAKGIPIITIASTGTDVSKTLSGISTRVILYDSTKNLSVLFGEVAKDILPRDIH